MWLNRWKLKTEEGSNATVSIEEEQEDVKTVEEE